MTPGTTSRAVRRRGCCSASMAGPGALDMVKFGPLASLPDRFRARHIHVPNLTGQYT